MVMLFEALSLRITGGSMKALPAYFAALPLQIASFWIGVYKAWRGKTCKVEGSTISTTKGSIHSCIRQYKRKLTLGSSATTLIA